MLARETITLAKLHLVSHALFQWSGGHLHQFNAGANATPADNCGGVRGYEDFVLATADPNHPEHDAMKEWVGRDCYPTTFDINKVNRRLAEFKL